MHIHETTKLHVRSYQLTLHTHMYKVCVATYITIRKDVASYARMYIHTDAHYACLHVLYIVFLFW